MNVRADKIEKTRRHGFIVLNISKAKCIHCGCEMSWGVPGVKLQQHQQKNHLDKISEDLVAENEMFLKRLGIAA